MLKEKSKKEISFKDKSFSRSLTTSKIGGKPNQKFQEELSHIKNFVEQLQLELKKHCLLSNEKEEFERIKKENIKLTSDVNILKDDVNDLMKKFQFVNDRINKLQGENEMLKEQNKYLLNFINQQNNIENEEIEEKIPNQNLFFNNFNSTNDMMFSNTIPQQSNNNKFGEQISEMSVFNNLNTNSNHLNNNNSQNELKPLNNYYSNYNNNKFNYNGNTNSNYSPSINNTNSNVTDLSALTQMNYNLTHQPYKNSSPERKRYLIPKSG